MIDISKSDWNSFETSWDFTVHPLIAARSAATSSTQCSTIADSFASWETLAQSRRARLQELETENNRLFIDAYGLQDELLPEVPDAQITLARANREADARRLVSYAIGCMMGRYSLDEPGLIYAHSGNMGFDASRYASFPADADGILPITDSEWLPNDDIAARFFAFLKAVWGDASFDLNLRWMAESLGGRAGDAPAETVCRYFVGEYYKNHLQTYKNRPIYWLFSSGKEKAFGALVYLHRYNEGTLARMRMEYVVPLQGRLNSRSEALRTAIEMASPADKRRMEKERQKLEKQRVELARFDEKLRHMADMRIALDLDDGVKVNYAKFGDLLAEVKLVTGGSAE